jgi:hypothetical protein
MTKNESSARIGKARLTTKKGKPLVIMTIAKSIQNAVNMGMR